MRRMYGAVAAVLIALVSFSAVAPASAQEYGGCGISISVTVAVPGGPVVVVGVGLQANITTTVTLTDVPTSQSIQSSAVRSAASVALGSFAVNAAGGFVGTVIIPLNTPAGLYTLSCGCDSIGLNLASTNLTIVRPAVVLPGVAVPPVLTTLPAGVLGNVVTPGRGGRGPLPRTGSDVDQLVASAALAVVAGTALVTVTRRRRHLAAI